MTRHSLTAPTLALALCFALGVSSATAQTTPAQPPTDPAATPVPTTGTAPAAPAAAAQPADDDPAALDVLEPDFSLVALPTTLRLPVHKGNFHMTHRFNLNLRCGETERECVSSRFNGLFGIDSGANVGFEYRFGLMKSVQAVVQRTSVGQTIQFSAKWDAWHQNASHWLSLSPVLSIEGENNFHNSDTRKAHFAPALGVVVSKKMGTRVGLYLEPFWVHATNNEGAAETRDTGILGLGGRLRLSSATYVMGEVSPRVGGLVILGDPAYGFALEHRVGAHVFALTFTNRPATTYRQLAQGGVPKTLNLGFNLTRKFF